MNAGKPNATAFPVVDSISWSTPGDASVGSTAGLSKREWFAGLAMQGIVGSSDTYPIDCPHVARQAVALADALLAELAKEVTP